MVKRWGEEMRFRDNKQLILNHVVNELQTKDTQGMRLRDGKE